jgi:hypothetical protein
MAKYTTLSKKNLNSTATGFLIWGIFLASSCLQVIGQEKKFTNEPSVYKSFNASYIIGAQLYNDNFLYNPGLSLQMAFGRNVNKDIGIGLGTGYMKMKNERFIPVYLEIMGKKKQKPNTPFIRFQGGYSIGWSEATNSMVNYDMKGGFYINAGVGRNIRIFDKYSILFLWSFCHQFAQMQYQIFGDRTYSETLNYDMVQVSVGLLFH